MVLFGCFGSCFNVQNKMLGFSICTRPQLLEPLLFSLRTSTIFQVDIDVLSYNAFIHSTLNGLSLLCCRSSLAKVQCQVGRVYSRNVDTLLYISFAFSPNLSSATT